jgi:hypothetical protein
MNCHNCKEEAAKLTPYCNGICDCVDWSNPGEWVPHYSQNFVFGREVLTYGSLDTICSEPATLCTLGKCKKCGKQICVGGSLENLRSFDDFMTRIVEAVTKGDKSLSADADKTVIALLHEDDREAGIDWLYARHLRESFEMRERDLDERIKHVPGYRLELIKSIMTGLYEPYLDLLRTLVRSDIDWLREQYERRIQAEKELVSQIAEYSRAWNNAAVATRMFSEAIDIAEAQRPAHTGNKWICSVDGTTEIQEISNAVYKMRITIAAPSDEADVKTWDVKWNLTANMLPAIAAFHNKYGKNGRETVCSGRRESISSEADVRAYLEHPKKAYAKLFTEEFPPVPAGLAQFFEINGVLLPEYNLEKDNK